MNIINVARAVAVIELPQNFTASTTEFVSAQIVAFAPMIYLGIGLVVCMTIVAVLFGLFHR